ncbi:MAG TPA: oligosaccharide flippase family protein, partial [Candidatus Babeliaceae bacterium]|nr:oligosaccharide flippase family protein [Candidatus Babeliaceae bacterium]
MMDAALYPVVYLATVRLLMHSMGMLTFGFWILLNSLITLLQLFNVNSGVANMGVTIIQRISAAVVNKDTQQINDLINSTLHITLALFILITGIGFFLSFVVVHYGWWGTDKLQGLDVASCILLATLFAGLKYFDQVFQSIIRAYEHFRLSSILNMINRFGLLAITLALAICKYSLLWILWSNVVFVIAYLLIQLLCIKRLIPAYRPALSEDRKLYRQLLHFNLWPWLQSIIIVFTFQTDRFWVSSYLGLKVVSAYGLVSTMFNHIHMIFTAMILWVLPRIAIMTSKGRDAARLYYNVRAVALGFIIV